MLNIYNFIAASAIGILTGLGTGSGGLFILYLLYVPKYDIESARSINLFFFVLSSLTSVIISLIKKRVMIKEALIIALFGIAFSVLGSYISSLIDNAVITIIFGVFFIISGVYALISKKKTSK